MTVAPFPDQEIISAHFASQMAQEVYDDGYPEPADMPWPNGILTPYIVIDYGMPVAATDGRGISGEEDQPTVQRVAVACVASSGKVAREIASKVSTVGVGFTASSNTGPLRLVGGGNFTQKLDAKPTVFISEVYFSYTSNMAIA